MKPEASARASLCALLRHDLEAMRRMDAEHSYGFHLDPTRLARLVAGWDSGKKELFAALQAFSGWLLNDL